MKFDKDSMSYRYVFDIDRGVLHDLRSSINPRNEGCGLERLEHWVAFDTERTPIEGTLVKKLTATREVVDIEVRSLCRRCMKSEDEELIELLQKYFLSRTK